MIEAHDLTEYFGLPVGQDCAMYRALKWAGVPAQTMHWDGDILPQIGTVTDDDWMEITRLSVEYAPYQDVKYDALGRKITPPIEEKE